MPKNGKKNTGEVAPEQLVDETDEQLEAQASEQPAPSQKDDIGDFLDNTYEDVKAPKATMEFDRDIKSKIVALVVANPVLRAIAEFLGVAPENFIELAWSTSYDKNAVSTLMCLGNVEMLQHHPNVDIKNALTIETQKASMEQQAKDPKRRMEPFFLGACRFICRVLQKEAKRQKTELRFTFEPGQTPEGQAWDSFTRVEFRHHKAAEQQRERAAAAAAARTGSKQGNSVSSYSSSLQLS